MRYPQPMAQHFFKGKQLERSVEAIETAIIQTSPMYNEDTFRLESPKIIVVDGVKHEIDVWVEVELAKGYNPVFIFECRNREEKADKNDIIVFSEKIDASQAQHGFFVARSFTQYAKAQADKDSRVTLLPVKELPVEEIPVPFDLHFVGQEGRPHAKLEIREAGVDEPEKVWELDVEDASFILEGEQIPMREYLEAWVKAAIDERTRTFPSSRLVEGVYDLEVSQQRTFAEGQLFVDDRPMSYIDLHVEFKMRVVRPPIESHFEVNSRGRSLSLTPAQLGDGVGLQMTFVLLEP